MLSVHSTRGESRSFEDLQLHVDRHILRSELSNLQLGGNAGIGVHEARNLIDLAVGRSVVLSLGANMRQA